MIERIATWLKDLIDWRQPGGRLRSTLTIGLIVSLLGHLLGIGGGIYGFSSAKPFEPASEAVAVDVVSDQQFAEMMKGDKTAKEIAKQPERRVDQVADLKKDNDPGEARKDVAAPEPPKASPPPPPAEPKVAAVVPPARPPELRVVPPRPTPPAEAEGEEEDPQAEIIRQKKAADKRKADEAAKAAAEEKRKLEETLKAEAEALKRAEDLKKAEAARREKEAKEKAKKELEAKEKADEQKLLAAITNKLNTSKEAPSSTGATGQQLASRSTAGTTEATGKKLSPSDRSQLVGILTEQMNRCISYSGTAPKVGPQLTFTMTREGGIAGAVQLANTSGEGNFRPFSEAAMRALRNCQPYRIPARFQDTYDDWKNMRLNIDTSELQ